MATNWLSATPSGTLGKTSHWASPERGAPEPREARAARAATNVAGRSETGGTGGTRQTGGRGVAARAADHAEPDDRASFAGTLARASGYVGRDPVRSLSEARRTVYDAVGTTPAEKEASLRWAAKQLESFFASELFKSMRATVVDGGLIPKSRAEKIYQQMLDQEMAKSISERSPLGIADLIVQQLEDLI